jgi:hypothetical protein
MAGTFRNKIGGWVLLNDALKQRLAELPEVGEDQALLEQLIREAQGLAGRQAELRGELSKVFRLRREAEGKGEELRQRLTALMQYKLGFKAEDLQAFGVNPRRPRRRSKGAAPAPGPEASAPDASVPAAPASTLPKP